MVSGVLNVKRVDQGADAEVKPLKQLPLVITGVLPTQPGVYSEVLWTVWVHPWIREMSLSLSREN